LNAERHLSVQVGRSVTVGLDRIEKHGRALHGGGARDLLFEFEIGTALAMML
jgi:hypothetical protein